MSERKRRGSEANAINLHDLVGEDSHVLSCVPGKLLPAFGLGSMILSKIAVVHACERRDCRGFYCWYRDYVARIYYV